MIVAAKNERENLDSLIGTIRETSYSEKKNVKTQEEVMDSFLDKIIIFQNDVKKKSSTINDIAERIEKLTWINSPNEETLKKLNELIVLGRDVRITLRTQYVSFNPLRQLASKEISEFKNAIDFLKESIDDIESTFFILPKNQDFVATTRALEA